MRLFVLLLCPLITIGQKECNGFVLDKITGNKVPYATVGLTKENRGVSANAEGAFSINASFPQVDCLRVSSVGYVTQVLPVASWVNGKVVELRQETALLKEVVVVPNQKKQIYSLNKFSRCSWNSYHIGLETIYQLAQRFEAPREGMQLVELELCKDPSETVFRLRIYDIDSLSQSPFQDRADSVIEVRSSESHMRIDLEKYHVFIPGKSFFVAIEWLFVPLNEEQEKVKRSGRTTVHVFYKPFLRWVTNRNLKKGKVWRLNFNGKWSEIPRSNQDYNFQITTKLRS